MRRPGMFFRTLAIMIALLFSFGGVLTTVSAASLTQHSSVLADEGDIGTPAVNVCDYPTLNSYFGPGSVADMLTKAKAQEQDVTCITVEEPDLSVCGALDITLNSIVTGLPNNATFKLLWVEGDTMPQDAKGSPLPAVFTEDYNGGTVTVTVFLVGPEKDYVQFTGDDVLAYSFWHSENGVQFDIPTDCETPTVTPTVTPTETPTSTPVVTPTGTAVVTPTATSAVTSLPGTGAGEMNQGFNMLALVAGSALVLLGVGTYRRKES